MSFAWGSADDLALGLAGRTAGLPPAPAGYAYWVDDDGAYFVDDDGAYILLEV